MVEQWTENPCVPGSIPGGTTQKADLLDRLFLYLYFMEIVVYILFSKSANRYYVGCSKGFDERLRLHNDKVFDRSYTRRPDDRGLYYQIIYNTVAQARRIESHIKRMKSRRYIENMLLCPEISNRLLEKYA